MKQIIGVILTLAAVTSADLVADQHGKGNHTGGKHQLAREDESSAARVGVSVAFSTGDLRQIREYYAPRRRSLPPGLRKKVERGGQLPPGWQKKMESLPVVLETRLEPLPREYRRGLIDGHVVIYGARSHAIIDVAVVF